MSLALYTPSPSEQKYSCHNGGTASRINRLPPLSAWSASEAVPVPPLPQTSTTSALSRFITARDLPTSIYSLGVIRQATIHSKKIYALDIYQNRLVPA